MRIWAFAADPIKMRAVSNGSIRRTEIPLRKTAFIFVVLFLNGNTYRGGELRKELYVPAILTK
jgi:hypothetical protein